MMVQDAYQYDNLYFLNYLKDIKEIISTKDISLNVICPIKANFGADSADTLESVIENSQRRMTLEKIKTLRTSDSNAITINTLFSLFDTRETIAKEAKKQFKVYMDEFENYLPIIEWKLEFELLNNVNVHIEEQRIKILSNILKEKDYESLVLKINPKFYSILFYNSRDVSTELFVKLVMNSLKNVIKLANKQL